MKNIISILLVSVFLFGCSKSGDSPNDMNETSGSIFGTWEMISGLHSFTRTYIYTNSNGTEFITNIESFSRTYTYFQSLTFREDSTYVQVIYQLDSLGNPFGLDVDSSYYSITGDILILGRSPIYNILITTLNNENLAYTMSDQYEGLYNDDTTFVDENIYEYIFVKPTIGINGGKEGNQN